MIAAPVGTERGDIELFAFGEQEHVLVRHEVGERKATERKAATADDEERGARIRLQHLDRAGPDSSARGRCR